jgi:Ca2+-transporting ATPase
MAPTENTNTSPGSQGSNNNRHLIGIPHEVAAHSASSVSPLVGNAQQLSSTAADHVKIDLNDVMAPFRVSTGALMDLVDPKNPSALKDLGGVDGVAQSLCVDLKQGIDFLDEKVGVARRRECFGKNEVHPPPPPSIWQLIKEAMKDKILILLAVAGMISLAIGIYQDVSNKNPNEPKIHWVEGTAIMLAVIIVVLVNSLNDYQKEKQFRKLNAKKEDRQIRVLRGGVQTQISIFNVVVGDVVLLEPGDVVPADGLVIESHNLACDESGATGESDAIKKGRNEHDPFLLSGTKVIEGIGQMLVIAVGPHSFHGKTLIALQVESAETPLQIKLDNLAESIAKVGASIAIALLIILIVKYVIKNSVNDSWPENGSDIFNKIVNICIQAITVVVVAVPEGLPMAVTLALAFATTRMIADNNLVRVLAACETMGNATTICSDKTGTLTQNKITIVQGRFGGSRFMKIEKIGEFFGSLPDWIRGIIVHGIAVNSTAYENVDQATKSVVSVGSKTEIALINFIAKGSGADYLKLRQEAKIAQIYPFSSQRKSMTIIIEMSSSHMQNSKYSRDEFFYRQYTKGASEMVLEFCDKTISADGSVIPLEKSEKDYIQDYITELASNALRTIGIAYRDFSISEYESLDLDNPSTTKMTFLGVVGIEDPLREGVVEAVKACQEAGIFVRMVTGDNLITAQSIASRCGILMKGGLIMEGPRFRRLSEDQLTEMIPRLQVLARSSPTDKQILVRKLREMGEVVAVTGDGTNDGPALRAADVGFSMGIAGTEVAKEASSIILMDDNFASIVKAVAWGRCVNDSVRKFLQFQLTVNVTAVLIAFISAIIDKDDSSVLSAVQLLWVNLIMDTLAALALATDTPTP